MILLIYLSNCHAGRHQTQQQSGAAGSWSHATVPSPRRSYLILRRKRRSHIADHVFSVCVDNRRRDGMPCVLQDRPNRVPYSPAVIISSFANALIKNSSMLPIMPPELRNVHGTNSMFLSAHNFPTGPSSLVRLRLLTRSTKTHSASSAPATHASASEMLC